jgi:osmotically-inducible protein OsmY
MTPSVPAVVALLLFSFLTTGCVTLTGETAEQNYDDATITTAVKSQLALNQRVKTLTNINVKTIKRTVYLSGEAKSAQEKTTAEETARKVKGVENVVNDIVVQP